MGRARSAAWTALCTLPLAACALLACGGPVPTLLLGAALYLLSAGLFFRGQVYGAAVGPGLAAGAAPMLAPLLLRGSGHCCVDGVCWSACMIACVGGGVFGGVLVGWFTAKRPGQPAAFWIAAAAVAALTGTLGCATAGLAGVLGMVAALVVSSAPLAGALRART
jgi:hypothetical protein